MSQNFAKGIPSVPTGPASGDLSGNYPSPTVSALQTNPVHAGTLTSLNDGYVLTWDNTDGYWHAYPITASALILAGDVTGPGNANTVVSITGASGVVNVASTGNIITWNSATTAPGLKQANLATNSGTGATMTIQAQNETGTTSTGGTLNLTSGTGTTAAGSLHLQTGGTTRLTANATGVITVANLGTGVVHADSSGNLTSSTIINADVSATAAIAVTKLAHGTDAQILLTNGTTPTWTTQSGDISLTDTGVTAVTAISGATPIVIAPAELQWASTTTSPLLDQASLGTAATNGSAGQTLSVSAQAGQNAGGGPYVGGTGGAISITSGAGGAAGGSVTNSVGGNITISTGAAGTGGSGGGSTGSFIVKTGSTTQMTATSSGITVSNLAGSGSGYVAVSNTGLLSFISGIAPSGSAGGDLSGTYPNPTVAKVNGTSVPAGGSLTTGNQLIVNGVSSLTYAALNLAGGSGYVTGNLPISNIAPSGTDYQVLTTNGSGSTAWGALNLAQSAAITGNLPVANVAPGTSAQVLMSNATPTSTWNTFSQDATVGATGAITVQGLRTKTLASSLSSIGVSQDGYVLTWVNANNDWEAKSALGGGVTWADDLIGSTGTNQYVASISGNGGAGGTIPINANKLQFASSQTTPTITQASISSGSNANTLVIAAQQNTGAGPGGLLELSGGVGGSSPGEYGGDVYISPGSGYNYGGVYIFANASVEGSIQLGGNASCNSVIVGGQLGNIYTTTFDNNGIETTSTNITFDVGASNRTITQAATSAGSGSSFTISAQNATGATHNGGNLTLSSGSSGSATAGSVLLQIGGTTKVTVAPTAFTVVPAVTLSNLAGSGSGYVAVDNSGNLTWGAGGGGGGLTAPVVGTTVTKTGNYTITTSDYIIFADTSGGAFNLTLPTPVNGNVYVVKDIKGTFEANNITLVRHASEKIEGIAASRALTTNWGSFTITSNGTDWFLLD